MAYHFDSRVRYSEVGPDRKLTLVSLVDYFQDASIFQSEERGIGVDFTKAHHCAWMILFWQIDILRLPQLGEKITSWTWTYAFKTFYGWRNFALKDEQNVCLAKAQSVWALIDVEQNCPIRVLPEMISGYGIEPKLEMEYLPRKIHVSGEPEKMEAFPVGKHHLDTNRHVNNGQYIRMAEEFLPEGFETKRLCVEYRQQAHLHDILVPYVYRSEDSVTVSLCSQDGAAVYAIVRYSR